MADRQQELLRAQQAVLEETSRNQNLQDRIRQAEAERDQLLQDAQESREGEAKASSMWYNQPLDVQLQDIFGEDPAAVPSEVGTAVAAIKELQQRLVAQLTDLRMAKLGEHMAAAAQQALGAKRDIQDEKAEEVQEEAANGQAGPRAPKQARVE